MKLVDNIMKAETFYSGCIWEMYVKKKIYILFGHLTTVFQCQTYVIYVLIFYLGAGRVWHLHPLSFIFTVYISQFSNACFFYSRIIKKVNWSKSNTLEHLCKKAGEDVSSTDV